MQLARFRHKGLRQLYEDDIAKGVPPEMADKLRKLLLAMETAKDVGLLSRFPGWEAPPSKRRPEWILEPDSNGELALDFSLRPRDEYGERH